MIIVYNDKAILGAAHNIVFQGSQMHQKAPLNIYEQLFGEEPSSDETITCGTALVTAISEADEKKWMETLEMMIMFVVPK